MTRYCISKGFSVRKAGENQPVDADTVFQLASLSKPIASTIVAGVVGDKVVSWDDPIIKHDSGFQMDNPYVTQEVTLRDMFSHRSGLPDHAGDLLEDLGFDRATTLYRLRYLPTYDNFRSVYAYTNFGLTEGAVAAATASGKAWEDLAEQRLYQRLGMNHTSSQFADYKSASNRALLHVEENGKWVAKYTRDPDTESPAGGVSSTVRDLAKWMRLQLGNGVYAGEQVIDADALAETHRPQIIRVPLISVRQQTSGCSRQNNLVSSLSQMGTRLVCLKPLGGLFSILYCMAKCSKTGSSSMDNYLLSSISLRMVPQSIIRNRLLNPRLLFHSLPMWASISTISLVRLALRQRTVSWCSNLGQIKRRLLWGIMMVTSSTTSRPEKMHTG